MDFAEAQRSPTKHPVGLGVVILLHALVGWALVSGLARKVVEVVKAPIETKLIEEIKPPPPPPPEKLPPPPPKSLPPPPAFVPPPEVQVTPPPTPQQTITTTTVQPPATEVKISAAPAVVSAPPAAPPAPPAPPARTAPRISFNDGNKPEYPPAAQRAGIECEVVVAYTMETDGSVAEAKVERSCGSSREHKALDRATVDAVRAVRGTPGTVDGKAERSSGRVTYVWKLE